jgi:hypothetical protein
MIDAARSTRGVLRALGEQGLADVKVTSGHDPVPLKTRTLVRTKPWHNLGEVQDVLVTFGHSAMLGRSARAFDTYIQGRTVLLILKG